MKISIVGAGISGLATAQAVLARKPDAEITIFEADQRVGGKVWTESGPEGYLCEGGVNGFLDKIPRTLELCKEVGITPVGADEKPISAGSGSSSRRDSRGRPDIAAMPAW